ncbi:CoA pyrophosphatase [Parasphingorhabdus sp.]|uniref:CoA pyrophosphatase n=1 Tax=Parasphingorhabdus sp. TaxID=2709688 RepID=UPI003D2D55A4
MTVPISLRDRLEKALAQGHENDLAHELYNERDHIEDIAGLRDAAVLIAVTDRPDPGVIFVQRPNHMRNHPGQVAFPGGKIDPGDSDAIDAALREAHEEVALERVHVDIIGLTDSFQSGSGYNIQPVLGVIPPDLPFVADPSEVESWFEAPLEFILDPKNRTIHEGTWNGRRRHYYEMFWGDYRIWGITAGILNNLGKRLGWPE